jgi:hypothetical protein
MYKNAIFHLARFNIKNENKGILAVQDLGEEVSLKYWKN